MIRPTTPEDMPALVALTKGTDLFQELDLDALEAVLAAYFAYAQAEGHRCFTDEVHGQVIGFVYFAPTAMTVQTWYLWWIVVGKQTQAQGVGSQLLKTAEDG